MNSLNNISFRIARKISNFLLNNHFKGSNLLRKFLCERLIQAVDVPIICSTLYGFDIFVDPNDKGLEKSIYYFGEYEAGIVSAFKKILHEGDTFLDIGANIGFLSLVAACIVDKSGLVYAVEPHPFTYKILEKNICLNGFKNIFSMNIALGKEISEEKIYNRINISRGSASLIRPMNVSEELGVPVRVSSIDILIEKGQIQLPNLIKIDVEGFELEVLKGAKILLNSSHAPVLCIEFSNLHPTYGGDVRDIYNFIKSANDYSFFKLKYGKGVPSKLVKIFNENDLPFHDNVFCFLNKELWRVE